MTGKPDVPKHLFSAISVGRLLDHPAANDTPEKNAFIEKCMPGDRGRLPRIRGFSQSSSSDAGQNVTLQGGLHSRLLHR